MRRKIPTRDRVCVVEDDAAVRQSLQMLIATLGVQTCGHGSGREFLDDPHCHDSACVVLDLRMPGMDGLEVQKRMAERGLGTPVIFITGHGDVPLAVEAMRKGAVDFLQKPFDNGALLERIRQALARSQERRDRIAQQQQATRRLASLSTREREVLDLLIQGHMNKTIAAELGISIKTVEDHRAGLMRKMQVRSVAELVLLATQGGAG